MLIFEEMVNILEQRAQHGRTADDSNDRWA